MATTSDTIVFARDDLNLIVAFAGCSLDEKPGSNFVQENGGLPDYICRIAKAIKRTGKTTSQAIAIALSRTRKWAAGADNVDADTRAKAAKAIAQWDALRAKSKAKTAAKKGAKVAASHIAPEVLMLTDKVSVFNVDAVRRAWEDQSDSWRTKWHNENQNASVGDGPGYSYITELWTDHVIVNAGSDKLFWVDYTVDSDGAVTFGDQKEVKTQYVVIDSADMVGEQISDTQLRQLMASVSPCHTSATDQVLLSIGTRPSALEMVLAARPSNKE